MAKLADSGKRNKMPSGMVREPGTGKGRFDLISPFALRRLAMIYELGAAKYAPRNWEKGGPISRFVESAERHIQQYKMNLQDEDHLAQAAWNIFAILHFQELKRGDLDDMPKYQVEGKCKDKSKGTT